MTERLDLDDIQGLVVRGYGRLRRAAYLLLAVDDAAEARTVLARWATESVTPASHSPADHAVHVALTAEGLQVLSGLAPLEHGFSEPFATGMVTPYRSRLLGDVGDNDPSSWRWGGSSNEPVHVLVLLFADTAAGLADLQEATTADVTGHGCRVVTALSTAELSDREHFGFHDGISQPLLSGLPGSGKDGAVVRDGEFVLGYVNEYHQRTERPLLPPALDPDGILPRDPDGAGAADLGRNGSYLVFRQLSQDVAAFEAFLDRADADRRELLAAKLVGRWRGSGASLVLAPDVDDPTVASRNDFGYHELDAEGLRCPVGAHVRRANPRDSLPPQPGTDASRRVNVRHRILRRGRGYGTYVDGPTDEGGTGDGGAAGDERGLHFLCLSTNLARQYEFVQHSWVNDPGFAGQVGVEDPLVGPRVHGPSSFVEPATPVRRRVEGLPRFVRVRGGAYFFLPGLRALRYLASGPGPATSTSANTSTSPT